MANHFLRISSFLACVPDKLDGKRKKDTVFAHIVGGVHFEGVITVFLLKYKQTMKNDEPDKTKKSLRLSRPSKWTPPTLWAKTVFLFLPLTSLSWTQAKDEESRRKRFAITVVAQPTKQTSLLNHLHLIELLNPLTYGRGQICPHCLRGKELKKCVRVNFLQIMYPSSKRWAIFFSTDEFLQKKSCFTTNCEQKFIPRDFSDRWGQKHSCHIRCFVGVSHT